VNHELPKGWIVSTIKNVSGICEQKVPDDDEQFLYVDIGSIDRDLKRIASPQSIKGRDAPSRARKCISTGDVLVSLTRPNLNAVALVTPDFDGQVASTGFEVLRPALVDSRYLFYLVRTRDFIEKISGLTQGALYPAAKSSDVREYQFPLAPLSEQARIADKLDRVLARVNAAQSRLDKIPALIKRFRQSVLAAATSGELTREWRENNGEGDWKRVAFSELYESLRSGSGLKPVDTETEYPVLRSSSVRDLYVDYQDIRYLADTDDRNTLKNGDLLFTRLSGSAEYVGNCALVCDLKNDKLHYPDRLFCARLKDSRQGRYLELHFSSVIFKKYILSSIKSSAGHQRITLEPIKKAIIDMPSENEQHEIVRRVESLFALADSVEKQYQDAKARTNRLTQAILAKAFRGELVPQNPDDEPAEVLLERIQAQRAAQTTAGKRGKARKVSG